MQRNRQFMSWVGVFAVGLLAGGILFSGFSVVRGKGDQTMEITVVEHATTDAVTDTGATGDSNGDLLTFANEVFDAENANKIGTDQGYCVRVQVGVSWECNWTLSLADGTLVVEGPFLDAGDSTLAITGGTGMYANATGEMTLHARNAQGSEYDFTYKVTVHDLD